MAAAVKGLDAPALWEVVIALGAQARFAADLAGCPGIGAAQLECIAQQLGSSPATRAAIAALSGDPVDAAPAPGLSARELQAAASTLARVTVTTMGRAGWHGPSLATLCRRAAL